MSEVVNLKSGQLFEAFAIAASPLGNVALAWEPYYVGHELQLKELSAASWHWSDAETIASVKGSAGPLTDVALGYDGSSRLLVAWSVNLGQGRHGNRWGVKARLRDSEGNWQPERLIANLPEKDSGSAASLELKVASGRKGFAVSWSAESSVSGFRVLDHNRWIPAVYLKGDTPAVSLLDTGTPLALWIQQDGKLVYASSRQDGSLNKPRTLARADSSLATSSFGNYVGAAWLFDHYTWASVWNGRRWSQPQRLGAYGEEGQSLAVAVTRGRTAVVWIRPGFDSGGSYALEEHRRGALGNWTAPSTLSPYTTASSVWAGGFASGELVLLGSRGVRAQLEIAHLRPSGKTENDTFPINARPDGEVFAVSSGVVAYAWEEDPDPDLNAYQGSSIQVWVYRP